jgi:DNA-binding response OmpR family regulator
VSPLPDRPQLCRVHILVVDDDPWVHQFLTAALQREGWVVSTAFDGIEGLRRASRLQPSLIITDVVMPRMDGWTFVRQLRTLWEFASTPVVFLTTRKDRRDRLRGFGLGADEYLPKPISLEQVLPAIRKALLGRQRLEQRLPASLDAERSELQGSLNELGLSWVLTLLESNRSTGILEVTRGDRRQGGVAYLRDGTILAAQLRRQDRIRNLDALVLMLGWESGSFLFTRCDVDLPDEIQEPIHAVLLAAAHRLEHQATLAGGP